MQNNNIKDYKMKWNRSYIDQNQEKTKKIKTRTIY